MKIRFGTLFLIGVIVLTANPCAWAHTSVTATQAHDLIDSTADLIIIDVREEYEYCGVMGHIADALNYPWNSGVLQTRYGELPKDGEILVVYQSGGRSNQAANFLDSKGFSKVYNMLGGMYAWQWETATCKYAGGSGTAKDPYQIASAEDLILLGESPEDYDKYFILTVDIDMDPNLPGGRIFDRAVIAPDTGGDGYTYPGTPFTGFFDGNRHDISNLTITGKSYLGLFGKLGHGAEVIDLGVADVNIIGSYYAIGGIAGDNDHGSITTSYSTGTVTGYTHLGGLVGYNNSGDITESFSNVTISSGNQKVGGLVGLNAGSITTSYSTGDVTAQKVIGGLVGYNIDIIKMCFSTSMVTSDDPNAGGLVGSNLAPNTDIATSFWDIETSGQTTSAGGEGKTTAEMMDPNTFMSAGWDFVGETINGPNDIWWILEGRDYPRLWWQLPIDDFEDGEPEPLWFVYAMEPDLAWLEETNGRLEANTAGAMEDVDAIYVSDGWQLDANEPFAIRIDFHFSKIGTGDGRLTLGLVPTIEGDVTQWAQFEAGIFDDYPFYLYEVRNDDWVEELVGERFMNDGILYMSYEPDTDELYFSDIGYGANNAIWTVTGLIHGRWTSESIYITLGGGSEDGMALTGEDVWLDNFTIDSGSIL